MVILIKITCAEKFYKNGVVHLIVLKKKGKIDEISNKTQN